MSAASTSTASGGIRPALLRQNPRVRLLPFDGASAHPVRLCEIPDATDTQIRRFTLPASLVPFLDAFDGTRTVDDAIAVFLGTDGSDARPPSAQRVRKLRMLVADALIPYHILVAPDAPAPEAPVRRSYMYARVRLLPAPVVRRIALPLRWLFTPTPAALLLLAAAVMHWSFYRRLVAGRSVSIATLQGTDVLAVIGLVALGTLIHEIGHATAAARYGCTRTEIGWGIYLSFTVLYTDLSEAWRLPRQQRAIIDGAGIYFQCIYLIGLYLVAAAWPGSLARHIFVLSDLAIVGSLNPFFRMDGYWLLSDALGIANLREETRRVWSAAWAWATRHRPVHSFHLPPLATACLLAYTVASTFFFAFVWHYMLTGSARDLVMQYPYTLGALVAAVTARPLQPSRMLLALFEVVWRGLALYGLSLFTWRSLQLLCSTAALGLRAAKRLPPGVLEAARSVLLRRAGRPRGTA